MAILVELNPSGAVVWSDDQGDVLWYGYGDAYQRDADDADTLHLSMDGWALDHYWDAEILSFSAPSYETAQKYGGFVRLSFGGISFSPDTFTSSRPPPKYAEVNVFWTATTEDAAIKIFEGNIYLESYGTDSVEYSFYAPTYSQELLQTTADIADGGTSYLTGVDYNGDDVPLPRAFGVVTHVVPVRLPDDASSRPTYHLGGLGTGTSGVNIESFSKSGTKTRVRCVSAVSWANGASVNINGSTNFNGTWTVESVSGVDFTIDTEFPTDNSERLPINAVAFTHGSFSVFDRGNSMNDKMVNNGDGTFSLTDTPSGEVTISGTGEDTTLTEIMEWAAGQFGIGTYDDSGGRGTSPDVGYWATSQTPLIDFVSELCAFFTHYFYIKSDQLYLCDMLEDNGEDSFDPFEYFVAGYSANDAIKQIKSEWITRECFEGYLEDDVTTTYSIKDTGQEVTVANSSYPWGEEMEVTPYHDVKSNITTALSNILIVTNKNTASISIPIGTDLPDPGKKITFTDDQMLQDMSTYIWARRLQFDLANDEVSISGEGVAA